jgi:hypothetical protein
MRASDPEYLCLLRHFPSSRMQRNLSVVVRDGSARASEVEYGFEADAIEATRWTYPGGREGSARGFVYLCLLRHYPSIRMQSTLSLVARHGCVRASDPEYLCLLRHFPSSRMQPDLSVHVVVRDGCVRASEVEYWLPGGRKHIDQVGIPRGKGVECQ